MSNQNHLAPVAGSPHYIEWCLAHARQQLDTNFAEVRQFPCEAISCYLRFLESLKPSVRWTYIEGMILHGLMPDRSQPEHKKSWDEYTAFRRKENSTISLSLTRPKKPRGPHLIKLLKAAWDVEAFGDFSWEQKNEFRADLTDRGWCLRTSVVFDRGLLRHFKIVDPAGQIQLDWATTLTWIGLGSSEWKDAVKGSEDEIAEQVIQLQAKYAKTFLHHFSRQDE